jgi:ATP-binding cassette subfamily C protein CydD
MIDKKLLNEMRHTRRSFAFTIGLGITSGWLTVLQAACFARIVASVFWEKQGLKEVFSLLALLLVVICLRAILSLFSEIFANRTAARIKEDLRQRLLAHLFSLGPIRAKEERTGELVNVLVEGIESLETYFAGYVPQLALAALVPLSILGFILPLDLLSGFILLVTAPLIPLFMILIGKWADSLSQKQWEALSRMSAHFLDVLQGLTTLKIFGRSKGQLEVIARVSDRFRETTLGVLRIAFLSALALELLSTLSTALVAVALGLRLIYGQIHFEQAFFILVLAPEFYLPLRLLGSRFHAGIAGVSAARRIFEILETPVPAGSSDRPGGIQVPAAGYSPQGMEVALENVFFHYDQAQSPVLRGASFQLLPGESVILTGASGSGKSTIVNLLLGLLQPDSGHIRFDGILHSAMPAETIRGRMAYVPQNAHLFYGSVVDNIRLGYPSASEEEVIEAARQAGAHAFIKALPAGYATKVGEGGLALSGGQVQRLALARAFIRKASLLILDEATAGLDEENEAKIYATLEKFKPWCTVLLITHRLDLAARADRVLILNQGRILEKEKAYGGAG